MDEVGHRSECRADAGAAADRVCDERSAQVPRRFAAIRAAIRPFERARRASRGVWRWPLWPGAVRLCLESHRTAAGGHSWGGQRFIEWRSAAPDQLGRRPDRCACPRAHFERRSRGRRAVERALAIGRVRVTEVRRQRVHERGAGTGADDRRCVGEGRGWKADFDSRRGPRRGRREPRDARRVDQRPERCVLERAARARGQYARHRRCREAHGRWLEGPTSGHEGRADLRSVHVRAHDVPRAEARGRAGAGADCAGNLAVFAECARHPDRVGSDSVVVRCHLARALCLWADPECVHAGWAHPRHGALGRRRGGGAGVDSSTAKARAGFVSSGARGHARGSAARAGLDPDHHGCALAGAALGWLGQKVVCAVGAHGRRGDDRFVLRQRVRDAGRVPSLLGPRRARETRQARGSGDRWHRRALCGRLANRIAQSANGDCRLRGDHHCRGVCSKSPAQHLFPRNR